MYQRVKNTRIKNYFIDILKLNPIQDSIPDYVRQDIQPTVEVDKPFSNILRRASCINTTTATIYTTPTDKDFYLTGANISLTKDVSATSTSSAINVTIDGVTQVLTEIKGISLTVQSDCMSVSLTHPIKVDRNTAITLTNATGTANVSSVACIQGYIDVQGGV